MAARSKARKRALDILFESELRGLPVGASLSERQQTGTALNPYAVTLVEGVAAHHVEIDRLITAHATGWTLPRMPAVDRGILRIGVYELCYAEDVPAPVAISEAVALARDLSTDGSARFVNGVLAAVGRACTAGEETTSGREWVTGDGPVS